MTSQVPLRPLELVALGLVVASAAALLIIGMLTWNLGYSACALVLAFVCSSWWSRRERRAIQAHATEHDQPEGRGVA